MKKTLLLIFLFASILAFSQTSQTVDSFDPSKIRAALGLGSAATKNTTEVLKPEDSSDMLSPYQRKADNKGGWIEHRVSGANFTTTSTSLVDITGFVTTTLSTGTLYEFEAVLYVNSSSTAGMAVGVQQSGTGTGQIGVFSGTATNAAATGIAIGSNSLNTASAACVLVNGNGTIQIRGFVKTGSSGSPTISLKALKTTSGTATVYVGSAFRYRIAQ